MPIVGPIAGRGGDLGGVSVSWLLPAMQRRALGPFVLFDEIGPANFPAGQGTDVPPQS